MLNIEGYIVFKKGTDSEKAFADISRLFEVYLCDDDDNGKRYALYIGNMCYEEELLYKFLLKYKDIIADFNLEGIETGSCNEYWRIYINEQGDFIEVPGYVWYEKEKPFTGGM